MIAWLVLALASQDPVEELLRRLDDESIEARTEAADLLMRRGPAVLPALEKAHGVARGELRDRLSALLARARERERLAALLRPATRLTLSVEKVSLKDVAARIGARSPTPVEVAPEAELKLVTIDLHDVPFWKALEDVCAAAGDVRLEPWEHGVRIVPGPPAAVPRALFDAFAVRLEGVYAMEDVDLGTPDRHLRSLIKLRTCWEKGTRPSRVRALLESLTEDTGKNLLEGLEERPSAEALLQEPDVSEELSLGFSGVPSEVAARLALRATVEVDFALRWAEVQFPAPWAGTVECAEYGARLLQVERSAGQVSVNLQIYPKSRPVAADIGAVLTVRDESGKSTAAGAWSAARSGGIVIVSASIPVPQDRPLRELRLRVPVEVHTERLPVDLPRIPLR